MNIEPGDHHIFMTEPPLNPKRNREKMTKMHFENFEVPGFFVAVSSIVALYEGGCTTGVVLDIGEGVTNVVPVANNYILPTSIDRLNLAGPHACLPALLRGEWMEQSDSLIHPSK